MGFMQSCTKWGNMYERNDNQSKTFFCIYEGPLYKIQPWHCWHDFYAVYGRIIASIFITIIFKSRKDR